MYLRPRLVHCSFVSSPLAGVHCSCSAASLCANLMSPLTIASSSVIQHCFERLIYSPFSKRDCCLCLSQPLPFPYPSHSCAHTHCLRCFVFCAAQPDSSPSFTYPPFGVESCWCCAGRSRFCFIGQWRVRVRVSCCLSDRVSQLSCETCGCFLRYELSYLCL